MDHLAGKKEIAFHQALVCLFMLFRTWKAILGASYSLKKKAVTFDIKLSINEVTSSLQLDCVLIAPYWHL